jgi:DNA-binding NtrC family response regulator
MTQPMTSSPSLPSVFSPLAKALLDSFSEGVVVFDHHGKILYLNSAGRRAIADAELDPTGDKDDLLPELAGLGGRLAPLKVGGLDLGEAIYLPHREGPTTLAEREKDAIVRSLEAHSWRLAETARTLGISRTTLWRRLRAYGLHRDGRTRWEQHQQAS